MTTLCLRALVGYGYKSVMRWITGLFVQIDPIGILKGYVEHLQDNLRNMNKQINKLRGQMHQLKEIIVNNTKEIQNNLQLASEAKNARMLKTTGHSRFVRGCPKSP